MQAEIVQWEKSVKAECIFYIDVILHQKGVLVKRSDWIELRTTKGRINMKTYQKGSGTAVRLLQGEGPVVEFQRAAENTQSRNHKEKRIESQKKGLRHCDAFQPCSSISSGGGTSRETNWKAKIEENDEQG